MTHLADRSNLSPEEFLQWERNQQTRHEYFRGDVFAMAGGSPRHNALCSSMNAALHAAFRQRGCVVLSSDQRLGFEAGDRYVYADVSVVCGGIRLEHGTSDVVTNPAVIVEVLSGSTEQYDRGLKWEGYQRLASLTDFLLVSQSEARIEHFHRESDGRWLYRSIRSGDRVSLSSTVELELDVIFEGILDIPGDGAPDPRRA